MDERLSDEEIKARASDIRMALAGLHVEDAARICIEAKVVRADNTDLKALSKYKILQDLAREKPDPRNLKLASEMGAEQAQNAFAGNLVIKVIPHTVADTSLASIIAAADEVIVEDMCNALAKRVMKFKTTTDVAVLAACRRLRDVLNEKFVRGLK